jgi:predicted ATPase/DNA-binding SARP family transcriptional activator/tetratricopeptide (TPR) repeat protein
MPELTISLLGHPKILIDGEIFDTDRRKAIALLAYLIVTGKPQPRDHLAAFFWPDYNRDSAFAYLRRTLYELNKRLGKGWIETDRHMAGFVSSTEILCDLAVFETELAAARLAKDPISHLEAALAQYKGEFMEGFFLQDAEPFEDWLRQHRENYRRDYAWALEQLVGNFEQGEYWDSALKHARTWVALDDFNEAAHRAIMRISVGMGDRNNAFRQYETCVHVLKDGLGIPPQPETMDLYEQIRTGSYEEAARPVRRQPVGSRAAANNRLPVLTTPFIGRRSEIDQVKELILHPKTRLLTLFGPGGSGKTRLSIQAASEIVDRFLDGVWFVPLATVQSPEGIIPALAKALNISFYKDEDTPKQRLMDYLREKQVLLILDNLDQLVGPETTNLLIEILTGADALRLLVTSRIRLNIQAEQIFPVPGMRMPSPREVASWTDPEIQAKPFSAVQLFLDRARRLKPNFTLDRIHAEAVADICQLVDGMPLGLELAASWLELLPPAEIAAEIRRNLDFLETDLADVPERQRSIRAVFEYSWMLLNEVERDAFLSLSTFIGSFSREAAQQVSGASLRTLLSLANKSWLLQAENGRFQLHPLLQHYGQEQLQGNERLWKNSFERHADYYASFVAEQFERMRGPDQIAALNDLSEEFNTNIRAGWDWLVANERWPVIREKMLPGLNQFGMMRWRSDEIITWMRKARSRIDPSLGIEEKLTFVIIGAIEVYFEESWGFMENRPEDRIESLWQLVVEENLSDALELWFVMLGKMYITRNQAPKAEALVDAAIDHIRNQGDPWLLGSALLTRSFSWGQFPTEASDQNLREALEIFRKLGTTYEQAVILETMAANARAKKRPLEEVADLFQQAQHYYSKANDTYGIGAIYWYLGDLYLNRGQPQKGFDAYHQMQRIFEQLGDQRMVGENLHWESLWAARHSTFQHALETCQRSVEQFSKFLSQTNYFWNIYELGEIYRIFGKSKKALGYYEEAGTYFKSINYPLGQGYYQRALGDIAMEEGRYVDALHCYERYQGLAFQDNHMWSMAHAFVRLAWVYAHLGEIKRSRSHIHRCLKLLLAADEVNLALTALLCEARCRFQEGKTDTSAALTAYVASHPITWNETRKQAEALLTDLSEKAAKQTLETAYSHLQGRDIRELTSEWLADYEAGRFGA